MTTRSSKLWSSRLVGRPSTVVYTTPAGIVTILKSMVLVGYSPVSSDLIITLVAANGDAVRLLLAPEQPAAVPIEWNGWVVLEAGDSVQYDTTGTDWASWGSGAELPVPF